MTGLLSARCAPTTAHVDTVSRNRLETRSTDRKGGQIGCYTSRGLWLCIDKISEGWDGGGVGIRIDSQTHSMSIYMGLLSTCTRHIA